MLVKIGKFKKDNSPNIKVEIHDYDTWSADYTLALVIVPLLEKLKEQKQSSPNVEDCDVPEALKSTSAPEKEQEYDIDQNWHLRWQYVMDEMLFAMRSIANHHFDRDSFYDYSEVDKSKGILEQFKAIKCDHEGLGLYNKRVQKGCELFGKYFQSLWS